MASTVISCSVHLKKSVFAQRMWHNCHLTALSCLTDWVTELGWHSIHIQSKHSKEISPSQRSVSLSNRTPIHPLHDELFSHVELWKIYKNEKLVTRSRQNSEDMRILEEITVRIEVKDVQSSSTHLLWKNIPLKKKTVGTELSNVSNVQ